MRYFFLFLMGVVFNVYASNYQVLAYSFDRFSEPVVVSGDYQVSFQYSYYLGLNQDHFIFLSKSQMFGDVSLDVAPMNYPNPFSFDSGTTLYYGLNQDCHVELYVFDLRGALLVKKYFLKGLQGGRKGQNMISIDEHFFNGYRLSPSVYFFVLVCEGVVLGRGKFAVKP